MTFWTWLHLILCLLLYMLMPLIHRGRIFNWTKWRANNILFIIKFIRWWSWERKLNNNCIKAKYMSNIHVSFYSLKSSKTLQINVNRCLHMIMKSFNFVNLSHFECSAIFIFKKSNSMYFSEYFKKISRTR